MFRLYFRTPEEKADLEASWRRPDEDFFGSGACHVLAAAFLEAQQQPGWRALLLQPSPGMRGSHVVVANQTTVFDCRGWNERHAFFESYAEAMRGLYPRWTYTLVELRDPVGWEFCRAHRHRHPSQFLREPLPRARAFLARFGVA